MCHSGNGRSHSEGGGEVVALAVAVKVLPTVGAALAAGVATVLWVIQVAIATVAISTLAIAALVTLVTVLVNRQRRARWAEIVAEVDASRIHQPEVDAAPEAPALPTGAIHQDALEDAPPVVRAVAQRLDRLPHQQRPR